jgi:two-component system alkaline phosphatase synthesis response regulator PhoP
MAKILLVEDDNLLQNLYKGKLTDEGFEVVVVGDGKKGLDLARSQKFDLILLDIILPGGINGFDVLESLKKDKTLYQIPVIIMTNLESEKKVALEIGAVDYFVKAKVLPNQVVSRIKEILKIKE